MKHAFSLVELSIVLVILGLLTGGILAGQSLIRASELRAVSTEAQRYMSAVYTFRDKYFAVAGDFRDATRFWGRLNGNADCATNSGAGVLAPGACDGNGDGSIGGAVGAGQSAERYQGWRHLGLAGLIEGSYTGIAGTVQAENHDIGINAPRSKISNAGWGYGFFNNTGAGSGDVFNYDYTNWLTIGTDDGIYLDTPFMKTEEAWNIDTKMDDGKPATGAVHAYGVIPCTTAAGNTDRTGEYDLADQAANRCSLLFRLN